jgi:hypothetical protein
VGFSVQLHLTSGVLVILAKSSAVGRDINCQRKSSGSHPHCKQLFKLKLMK